MIIDPALIGKTSISTGQAVRGLLGWASFCAGNWGEIAVLESRVDIL